MGYLLRQKLREVLKVYVITGSHPSMERSVVDVVRQATAGGAHLIQLRDKSASTRKLVETGRVIREITAAAGTVFLVNDRVDIAQAVEADGVHLGQDDLPAELARQILGPDKIVGVSVETPAEARDAQEAGADYVAAGPIFATSTKPDAGKPYGPGLIGRIKAATKLPVVAIGGINAGNLAEVVRAGADGVAVISAVASQPDIIAAVCELVRRFRAAEKAEKSGTV